MSEFDYGRIAQQTAKLTRLANAIYEGKAARELEISAFRAELDGDLERFAALRGRMRADTSGDLAMLTACFLSGILRRNQALVSACLSGVEALAAEARDDCDDTN